MKYVQLSVEDIKKQLVEQGCEKKEAGQVAQILHGRVEQDLTYGVNIGEAPHVLPVQTRNQLFEVQVTEDPDQDGNFDDFDKLY